MADIHETILVTDNGEDEKATTMCVHTTTIKITEYGPHELDAYLQAISEHLWSGIRGHIKAFLIDDASSLPMGQFIPLQLVVTAGKQMLFFAVSMPDAMAKITDDTHVYTAYPVVGLDDEQHKAKLLSAMSAYRAKHRLVRPHLWEKKVADLKQTIEHNTDADPSSAEDQSSDGDQSDNCSV